MSDVEDQRRYYERMIDEVGSEYRCRIGNLQAENDELRELVRISIEFCANGMCALEDYCPLNAADGRCMFDERARELGIEVDA